MGGMSSVGGLGGMGGTGIGAGIGASMCGIGAGIGAGRGGTDIYGMGGTTADGGMKSAGDAREKSDIQQLAEVLRNLTSKKDDGELNKADANQRSRLPIPKFYDGSPLNFHILLKSTHPL